MATIPNQLSVWGETEKILLHRRDNRGIQHTGAETMVIASHRDSSADAHLQHSDANPTRKPGRSETPATILVVDDDRAVRGLAVRFLKMLGYAVLEAETGAEALAVIADAEHHLDGVILDVTLPDMSGLKALQQVHAMQKDMPVVLCSGRPQRTIAGKIDAEHIAGYLEKPYDIPQLKRTLETLCRRQPATDQRDLLRSRA